MSNKIESRAHTPLSRRKFLQQTSVLGGAALSANLAMAQSANVAPTAPPRSASGTAEQPAPLAATTETPVAPDAAGFVKTSSFLTGHTADAIASSRFFAALTNNDPSFTEKLAKLNAAIAQAKPANMDAFLPVLEADRNLKATATTIVSAWYLGVVGSGDKAVLISFYDALMFEATRSYTYVPSYGGGPDSWVRTPPFNQA